jgi:hypothetical protein
MKKDELYTLIHEKKDAHQLTHVEISCSLICQHVRRNKPIFPPYAGTKTQMAPIEKYMVSLMDQHVKMCQPLNIS